ncbi:BsuPI-related putative proteinase inhibitor [Planococcus sp. X10-3]|uniref:BsuPI-related putative proteinase inhibitor n=1 Tax=Planococcus sp. X10-3 TaxID=3061240 RepID=UPI003BB0EE2C
MNANKILTAFILIALATFLAACGTSDSGDDNGASEGVTEEEVTAVLEQMDNNLYRYTVNNQTDEAMTFNFTSGQRFDFTLTNEADEELYRLSSVSSYIQALGEETIEAGEALEYEFEVPSMELESGVYTITAWLTPQEGAQYEAETEYTVE